MVTDSERNLYLSDIAGLPFGHVPCKLASCFGYILDSGGEVSATVKGGPVPSFPPWPLPTDKGGGVVIPCSYSITVDDIEMAVSKLKDTLSQMPEGNAMEIVIV